VRLLKAFLGVGHVAYMGDSENDLPAWREADVKILARHGYTLWRKGWKNRSGLVSIGLTAGSTRRLQRRDAQIAAPIGAAARRTKTFPSCRPCRRRGQHLSQNRSALEGGGRRTVGRGPATALGALMLAVRLNARGSRAAAEQQHRI